MPAPDLGCEETARPQEDRSRGELANVCALTALLAFVFAYLTTFTVLGDGNYASKFENGVLPAGFNGSDGQAAAVTSIVCAVFAFAATVGALALRVTKTSGTVALLAALASVPYALLEMVTWQLAF